MRMRPEYLTQAVVEKVTKRKQGGYVISFEGGGKITVKNKTAKMPDEIIGLSLLTVVHSVTEPVRLHFGRVQAGTGAIVNGQTVDMPKAPGQFKVEHPNYESSDRAPRNLEIPAHPDEREAAGPEESE